MTKIVLCLMLAACSRGGGGGRLTQQEDEPVPVVARTAAAPARPADTPESRASNAAAVVASYLTAEQTLGANRLQFLCDPIADPGGYNNLMEWKLRPGYLLEKAVPPGLPRWFKFTVDVRATNGFGAALTTAAQYWIRITPAGDYRIFWSCRHTDCENTELGFGFWISSQPDDIKSRCGFPGDVAKSKTKTRGK